MCGICGIYEYGLSGEGSLDAIDAMTASIAHRGPDATGTWRREGLALGHRRLSIFDLSEAGTQPMSSADGRVVVVFNGEIYNFIELRAELERAGVSFRTGTDTEVLIALYQRQGIESLRQLRGMFAFALWDEAAQQLFLVRDRFGVKPLYYTEAEGRLVFGSEVKALLKHPRVRAVLDREQLAEWLALRYTTAPNTLFKGIRKLEPGCYLRAGRDGVRQVRYWEVNPRLEPRDREEALERYRELFRESIQLRLRADVPVGIFLSGGLDSSMVALEAAAIVSHPLHTFTVGYRDSTDISELKRARLVADYLGTQHHELLLDAVDPELLKTVTWHLEEPVGDPATVLSYSLSEFTRRHVTVALSGEGSDETNFGYTKTQLSRRWTALHARPVVGPLLARAWLLRNAPKSLVSATARTDVTRVYAEMSWPGAAERALQAGAEGSSWLAGLKRTEQPVAGEDFFSRLVFLDVKSWLGDDLLLKVDKMTMAHGLEAREPFLDHPLAEFSLSLPPEWKLNGSGTKLFARDAMRGRLPEAVLTRRQHGFIAPLPAWFSEGWQSSLAYTLRADPSSQLRALFAPALFERITSGMRTRGGDALVLAFMLMSLERWLELFDVEVE